MAYCIGVANFISLTGESEPQSKAVSSCDVGAANTTIFDLQNVLFSGTDVISGNGMAIVVSTGSGKFFPSAVKFQADYPARCIHLQYYE